MPCVHPITVVRRDIRWDALNGVTFADSRMVFGRADGENLNEITAMAKGAKATQTPRPSLFDLPKMAVKQFSQLTDVGGYFKNASKLGDLGKLELPTSRELKMLGLQKYPVAVIDPTAVTVFSRIDAIPVPGAGTSNVTMVAQLKALRDRLANSSLYKGLMKTPVLSTALKFLNIVGIIDDVIDLAKNTTTFVTYTQLTKDYEELLAERTTAGGQEVLRNIVTAMCKGAGLGPELTAQVETFHGKMLANASEAQVKAAIRRLSGILDGAPVALGLLNAMELVVQVVPALKMPVVKQLITSLILSAADMVGSTVGNSVTRIEASVLKYISTAK